MTSPRRRRAPLGALLLLLLLALLLPLGVFLAGTFPGGGRLPDGKRKGPLRIRVLSEGAPVEGAHVLIEGLAGGSAAGTTGPDGVYEPAHPPGQPVRIEARAASGRAVAWADPRVTSSIELAVAPPRVRRGRVAGGAAEVRLLDRDGNVLASTETDAEGRYALEELPGAEFVVALSGSAAPAVVREGDIDLGSDAPCKGKIHGGGSGEVTVHALIPSAGEDDQVVVRWAMPLDGAGGFEVRLPRGASAWTVVRGMPVPLREGEIELPRAVRGEGRILRPDGAPAAGATLRLSPLSEGGAPTPVPPTAAETDADGKFDLPELADLAYSLEVRARGCATVRLALFRPADGAIEIRLQQGFEMDGAVVDGRGLPIAGAEVRALGVPDPDQSHPVATETTDERGRFRLDGLGGSTARVRVTAPGFHPTTIEKVQPGQPVRVVLQRQ